MKRIFMLLWSSLMLFPLTAQASETLEITFFNVGKADAIVMMLPDYTVVMDTGKNSAGAVVTRALSEKEVAHIDYMIITHFDKDHVGGADKILDAIPVDHVLVPDYQSDSKQYLEFLEAMEKQNMQPEVLKENRSLTLGNMILDIDVANASYYGEDEENDFSLVTSLTYGKIRMLFAGDAENPRLKELLQELQGPYDLLKVPHHGRLEKKSQEFFALVSPDVAVITSSEEEMEEASVVSLLQETGCTVYLTRQGTVTVTTDGNTMHVEQEGT
ncbi:MAG: MBL fold metallo-hydrolase [Clostridia bacterium]|nr:MBL fold metallo-hydrolase [Clostridia bacterium]